MNNPNRNEEIITNIFRVMLLLILLVASPQLGITDLYIQLMICATVMFLGIRILHLW